MRLCLASASAGRLKVLTGAGITPTVHVSRVDEDAILGDMAGAPIAEQVLALAKV